MRILLDNNVDHRVARLLLGHDVTHARQLGWGELYNGDLITAVDEACFAALITGDKNVRFQQNLKGRRITVVTLNALFVDLPGIKPLIPQV